MAETTYSDLPVVMDVTAVATILGCSERHVRSLIASGDLGHVRLGRLVKVPRHALLKLLGATGNGNGLTVADETVNPLGGDTTDQPPTH